VLMPNRRTLLAGSLSAAALLIAGWLYFRSHANSARQGEELLSRLPSDSTSVIYADLTAMRQSPFFAQLLAWAPAAPLDEEYTKFVQATGFDYGRDLDLVGIAFSGAAQNPMTMAVAEGRFDRKKIEAYSAHFGTLKTDAGKTIYAVPMSKPVRTAYFTFLRDNQVALCNDASCFFQPPGKSADGQEWSDHFVRLAGTPLFGIMRQDSQLLSALPQRSPAGWRSPQLATLLAQLRWVSVSAKPDGEQLRVVADGESPNEATIRQLSDMLGGLLILAQA